MMDEEKLFVILYYTPYTQSGHIYKVKQNNTVDEGLQQQQHQEKKQTKFWDFFFFFFLLLFIIIIFQEMEQSEGDEHGTAIHRRGVHKGSTDRTTQLLSRASFMQVTWQSADLRSTRTSFRPRPCHIRLPLNCRLLVALPPYSMLLQLLAFK